MKNGRPLAILAAFLLIGIALAAFPGTASATQAGFSSQTVNVSWENFTLPNWNMTFSAYGQSLYNPYVVTKYSPTHVLTFYYVNETTGTLMEMNAKTGVTKSLHSWNIYNTGQNNHGGMMANYGELQAYQLANGSVPFLYNLGGFTDSTSTVNGYMYVEVYNLYNNTYVQDNTSIFHSGINWDATSFYAPGWMYLENATFPNGTVAFYNIYSQQWYQFNFTFESTNMNYLAYIPTADTLIQEGQSGNGTILFNVAQFNTTTHVFSQRQGISQYYSFLSGPDNNDMPYYYKQFQNGTTYVWGIGENAEDGIYHSMKWALFKNISQDKFLSAVNLGNLGSTENSNFAFRDSSGYALNGYNGYLKTAADQAGFIDPVNQSILYSQSSWLNSHFTSTVVGSIVNSGQGGFWQYLGKSGNEWSFLQSTDGSPMIYWLTGKVNEFYPLQNYNLTVSESGLPAGTSWNLTFAGQEYTLTNTSYTFSVVNGTYDFTVASAGYFPAYSPAPPLTVNGSNVAATINFTSQEYPYTIEINITNPLAGTGYYQQKFILNTINATLSSSYSNQEFSVNSSPVYAWIESHNASYETVFAKIPRGTSIVNWTIFSLSSNEFSTGYMGEAPQLSPSYGEYDNAALKSGTAVFEKYWNFNGTTLPAAFTVPTNSNYTINNGFTATKSAGSSTSIYASIALNSSIVAVWGLNMSSSTYPGSANQWQLNRYSQTSPGIWIGSSGQGQPFSQGVTMPTFPISSSGVYDLGIWNGGTSVTWYYSSNSFSITNATTESSDLGLGWSVNSYSFPIEYYLFTRTYETKMPSYTLSGPILPSGPDYRVSVTATGLAAGTSWTFVFNGQSYTQTNSSYNLFELNGTYSFSYHSVSGYNANGPSSVIVVGANQTVRVQFTATYTVTVQETGLSSGTSWSFIFDGTSETITASTFDFTGLFNATYSLHVSNISGYSLSYPSSVVVNGASKTVTAAFTTQSGGGTSGPSTYGVSVSESGLPSGITWYIYINGTRYSSSTSTMPAIDLPNGTYNYTISSSDRSYTPSPASGNVTINGQPFQIGTVNFAQASVKSPGSPGGNGPGGTGGNNGTGTIGGTSGLFPYLYIGGIAGTVVIVAIILFYRKKGGPPIESGKEL